MAEDLDALFELFEDSEADQKADVDTEDKNTLLNDANTAPTLTDENQIEDDMLLFLADECAPEQQLPSRISRKKSSNTSQPRNGAIGPSSTQAEGLAAAAPPTAGKNGTSSQSITAPTTAKVQMSRTGAFAAVNKANSSRPPASSQTACGNNSSVCSGPASTRLKLKQQQQRSRECLHFVEKLTNLKIRNPRVSGIVLRERYKQMTYVPISKARDHDHRSGGGWVVIGVLVAKSFSTTSQGCPFSKWRLADLAGADVWISLLGDAHKDNYAEAEGSILAFYNPKFSSKGPGGSSSSSSSLAVSQSHQVELLATSAGWGFCKGRTKTGARCHNAVDVTVSCYCQYHALQQAKTLRKPAAAGVRKYGGQGGVKTALGLGAAAAAVTATADNAPPLVAAASNGKVFDAKSNSWSSSSTSAAAAMLGSSLAKPGGGSGSSRAGGSAGPGTGSSSSITIKNSHVSSSYCSSNAHGQHGKQAAAVTIGATTGAAAKQQAHDVREKLRQLIQQQQSSGQAAGTVQRPAAAAIPCSRGAGFSLSSVLAAVSSSSKQQQREEVAAAGSGVHSRDSDHEDPAAAAAGGGGDDAVGYYNQHQENIHPAAALEQQHVAAAADDDDDSDVGKEPCEQSAPKRPCIDSGRQQAPACVHASLEETAAATTATGGVTGICKPVSHLSPSLSSAAASAAGANSKIRRHSVNQRVSSAADSKLRKDLGLGPKPGGNCSSKAVSGSSSSRSKPAHVSRIGLVGAAVQQKTAGPGLGSRTAVGGRSSGSSNSGFKAAFSRVLHRDDVSQPRSELLAAAADQKHAALMGKLLDQFEQKDQLAQQLEGITKLQVTAFECRTCKILTEKRRATCSGHDVVAVRVMKRWWTCDACGWKIHTLRELMPTKRCPKCRDPGVMFTAASAYNAPKPQLSSGAASAVASRDALLPRGVEHAFCLQNSL